MAENATWLFVRHAESVANAEGWLAGRRDVPLSERGIRQAKQARANLDNWKIDRVYCSEARRARKTAEILLEGMAIYPAFEAQLWERDLGEWEGEPLSSLRADGRMKTLLSWTGHPPGGQSGRDVAKRVIGWAASVDAVGTTLVVAHGGVIRSILGILDGLSHDSIGFGKIPNCTVMAREIPVGTWAALLKAV